MEIIILLALGIQGSIVLFIITAWHIYWLFGGEVGTDRYTPLDKKGERRIPGKLLTFLSALVFFIAALIPLVTLDIIHSPAPNWLLAVALIFGVVVLLVRGLGGLVWSLLQPKPRDIFHRWNIGLYTWVCLFLAASYLSCLFLAI